MIKLTVTTPAPLSDEEKQKLAVAFNTQYKEKVAVDYRTDNALSASLIVFDGKNESSFTKLTVYDGSVKTKLENLKERLTHGND